MTPEELRQALASLREAGIALRRRPVREAHAALERVLDTWHDPASPWRAKLEASLPAATGFHPETVRDGLARGLAGWSGDALRKLIARELGGADCLEAAGPRMVSGHDTTALLLAGSIPMPTLLSLLLPLVLRSPVLARCAARDPVTAPLVADSIAAVDEGLGRCVRVVCFDRGETALLDALLEADCVVATGSDETVASVARRVRPPRRLLSYGHRLSLAVLGPAAVRGEALDAVSRRLALDVSAWDQLGCLSPVAVYVVDADRDAADRVAVALATALAAEQERCPRGAIDAASAAAIRRERSEAELRSAPGQPVRVHGSTGTAWTVVREADATPRPAPLHRFVRVHPVAELAGLEGALRPLAPHLAGVALEGFGADEGRAVRGIADLGASRVCRPGRLQAPPLDWSHDGQPLLLPLARLSGLEDDETDAAGGTGTERSRGRPLG